MNISRPSKQDTSAPHGQPALEGPEDTRLVWASVQGAAGVQTAFKVVGIMLPPISREDVLEAASEGRVFPPFDRSA